MRGILNPGSAGLWRAPVARWLYLAVVLACLSGCAPSPASTAQTITFTRTVDLTHTTTQTMPALPNEPPTYLQRTDDGDLQALHLTIRQGTYLRLPADTSFEHMSPRRLLVSAVVIDSRDRVRGNPNYRLAAADISAWEREHGRIPRDALVLLVTGWDMRWGNTADYLHLDDQQTPVVPGISAEAAELLYERGVRGIGIDTPIPVTFDGWRLANLTNLEQLPPTGATLSIGALKLQAAAISPVRVLALLP